MHQRRQLEPYKVDAAVSEAKKAIAEGRQVVIFAARVNESEVKAPHRPRGPSSTIDEERKIIASSQGTMELLRDALGKEGIAASDIAEIHGGQTKNKSLQSMAAFQRGEAKVVIATVESGGTGINLDDRDGDKPRTLIMMTPPFSAVDNVQAAGRVWRMSTKSNPEIKYLKSNAEIDAWNHDLIANKMAALNAAVKGESIRLVNMEILQGETAPRPPRPLEETD
jgi:superfamily II DNA/RNA helicase